MPKSNKMHREGYISSFTLILKVLFLANSTIAHYNFHNANVRNPCS